MGISAALGSSALLPAGLGFRNLIINGDFRVNQRGFSSTTTNAAYGFDRWFLIASNGTSTYSAQTFTVGNAIEGQEPRNFARIVSTGQTLSSALSILAQRIESVRTLAGQTATVSFWAKAASGTPKVAVELSQSFGTGGSPSSAVNTYVGQATLSTSWQRFTFQIVVPSISGKTIGLNNDDFLGLNLWTSAGSDYNSRTGSLGIQSVTVDFWGVQVEQNYQATPFEQRPIGVELALCQRYYYRIAPPTSGYGKIGSGYVVSATGVQAVGPIWFPTTMRTAPTVAFTFSGNNLTAYDGTEVNVTAFADASPWTTTQNMTFNLGTNSGLTSPRTAHILHRGSNFDMSAEL